MVDGPHRLLWLKNSSNPSGAKVKASAAALYSTLYPACNISVHSHLSSPSTFQSQNQKLLSSYSVKAAVFAGSK